MSDVVRSIDSMIEMLNKAKVVLDEETLESMVSYFNDGLYKEESLAEVTSHVHQKFAEVLTDTVQSLDAAFEFGQATDEVVTFSFKSELLGSIGELEIPDPMLFIKGATLGKLLEEQGVEELETYTKYIVSLRDILKEHAIGVSFY